MVAIDSQKCYLWRRDSGRS